MQVYISDFYTEFYIVYPDQKHYITLNYAAGYSYHMYNWQQFFGKKWCQEHIHLSVLQVHFIKGKPVWKVRN